MLYEKERKQLCKYVKNMYDRKMTNTAGGNVSMRINEKHYIMTPTLMSQRYLCDLTPDQILVIDMEGNLVEGNGGITREINMHIACYEESPETNAVVHAHALVSMVFATLGLDMPNITEASQKLGKIRCLPFHPATTQELADELRRTVKKEQRVPAAYLLRKHGVLVMGKNIEVAYDLLERLEWNAYIAQRYITFSQLGVKGMDLKSDYNFNTEE